MAQFKKRDQLIQSRLTTLALDAVVNRTGIRPSEVIRLVRSGNLRHNPSLKSLARKDFSRLGVLARQSIASGSKFEKSRYGTTKQITLLPSSVEKLKALGKFYRQEWEAGRIKLTPQHEAADRLRSIMAPLAEKVEEIRFKQSEM